MPFERGIDSHPTGWMAPTSCPANVGCLPGLLSDSTISQWHPRTHQTSRKKDVLQKQKHVARADGNSRSRVHSEASPQHFSRPLVRGRLARALAVKITSPLTGTSELVTQIVRGWRASEAAHATSKEFHLQVLVLLTSQTSHLLAG